MKRVFFIFVFLLVVLFGVQYVLRSPERAERARVEKQKCELALADEKSRLDSLAEEAELDSFFVLSGIIPGTPGDRESFKREMKSRGFKTGAEYKLYRDSNPPIIITNAIELLKRKKADSIKVDSIVKFSKKKVPKKTSE